MKDTLTFTRRIFEDILTKKTKLTEQIRGLIDCFSGLELKYRSFRERFGDQGHVAHILNNTINSIGFYISRGIEIDRVERSLTALHTYLDLVKEVPEFREKELGRADESFFPNIPDMGKKGLSYDRDSASVNYAMGAVERILSGRF